MKKLPKEVKAQWVEALRSGEYEQGKYYLRFGFDGDLPDQFCCLGVYLNEIDPDDWNTYDGHLYEIRESTGGLPFGTPHRHVFSQPYESTTVETFLTAMNDDGTPFSEIADWIEEHL